MSRLRLTIACVAFLALSPTAVSADTASPITAVEPPTAAALAGTVVEIVDGDTFVLEDEGGAIHVNIAPGTMPVAIGDSVIVRGFAADNGVFDIDAIELETIDDGLIHLDWSD